MYGHGAKVKWIAFSDQEIEKATRDHPEAIIAVNEDAVSRLVRSDKGFKNLSEVDKQCVESKTLEETYGLLDELVTEIQRAVWKHVKRAVRVPHHEPIEPNLPDNGNSSKNYEDLEYYMNIAEEIESYLKKALVSLSPKQRTLIVESYELDEVFETPHTPGTGEKILSLEAKKKAIQRARKLFREKLKEVIESALHNEVEQYRNEAINLVLDLLEEKKVQVFRGELDSCLQEFGYCSSLAGAKE